MKTITIILLGVTILAGQSYAFPNDGTDAGNGGDEYAKQFITLGTDIAESLAQNPLPEVTATELMNSIRATKVNSNDQLTLNGNDVDAINYPGDAPKILVSRMGWDRMAREPHRRAFLVLHEYLGIMGKDDSRYQISMMLDRAGVCGRTSGIRHFIERYLHKSCYRIINDDLQYVEHMEIMDPDFLGLDRFDLVGLSSLNSIGIYDTKMSALPSDVFDLVAGTLKNLTMGASMSDWGDCGFLKNLKQLESMNVGWTNSTDMVPNYRVKKLGLGCFAANQNLKWINMDLDFSNGFSSHGFMHGLDQHRNLTRIFIKGFGLEKVDPSEYSQIPSGIPDFQLFGENGSKLNEEYAKKLNMVLHRNDCQFNDYTNGTSSVRCHH